MSVRTATLTQLRDGVADAADVSVAASGVRHTHTLVDARINRAIQRWKQIVADAGDDTGLLSQRVTCSTSATKNGTFNWAPREWVGLTDYVMLLRGATVWDGSTPYEMMPFADIQRSDAFSWIGGGGTGLPVCYRLSGHYDGARMLQLFPYPDAAYVIDVRYIKSHVDLTTGTDTVEFASGGAEWVINDAAMQTLLSDGLAGEPAYAALAQRNAEIKQDMISTLSKAANPRKADTWARRRALLEMARGRWRAP